MRKTLVIGVAVVVVGFAAAFLWQRQTPVTAPPDTVWPTATPTAFALSSSAFAPGDFIPVKYTCDGENISPPLTIHNIPDQTASLVLLEDDIDSPRGQFVHWLLWNIDPGQSEIREGITPPGAGVGVNDFQEVKYGGPCPPSGEHRYQFTLYAVDKLLVFTEKTYRDQVIDALNGHVIAKTTLIGRFKR